MEIQFHFGIHRGICFSSSFSASSSSCCCPSRSYCFSCCYFSYCCPSFCSSSFCSSSSFSSSSFSSCSYSCSSSSFSFSSFSFRSSRLALVLSFLVHSSLILLLHLLWGRQLWYVATNKKTKENQKQ